MRGAVFSRAAFAILAAGMAVSAPAVRIAKQSVIVPAETRVERRSRRKRGSPSRGASSRWRYYGKPGSVAQNRRAAAKRASVKRARRLGQVRSR